jgi:hypothetical protein
MELYFGGSGAATHTEKIFHRSRPIHPIFIDKIILQYKNKNKKFFFFVQTIKKI